jgi:glucosyl-3-phosphoglycerate synthase
LNESATIASIIEFAKRSPLVSEVIVVDDGSIDGTPEIAEAAGARVITSTLLGKGASMEDGLREATSEILVYLDGDLTQLHPDTIALLMGPILAGEADFVKAKFARQAGRVTILTAKPLIQTYFPELAHLDQPLSGVMAARKSLLEQLRFENDYGVDAGLLIDAFLARAKIVEVDIGYLEHQSHDLAALGRMATQVSRTLLQRAAQAGRLRPSFIREVRENERLARLDLQGFLEAVPTSKRIALFDMDGVLLQGRFVRSLAQAVNRESQLDGLLDNHTLTPGERMRKIAGVFAGIPKEIFEEVARAMPLMPGAVETVVALRKAGYSVGIITDSYHVVSEIVRRRVFADFSFANVTRFKNGKSTGKVMICPAMIHPDGCENHDHCKVNVTLHLAEYHGIKKSRILAVGDGENDICLLRAVGCSVAFQPKNRKVSAAAQFQTGHLPEVLNFALASEDEGTSWVSRPRPEPLIEQEEDRSDSSLMTAGF